MYTIPLLIVVRNSDESSSFLNIQTKNLSPVLGKGVFHFCVLIEGKNMGYCLCWR